MESAFSLREIPKFSKKLRGSFWGITSFFNPAKYPNKVENYQKFRNSLKRQGLKLVCVETVFDDSKFELKDSDAEILIQIRGNKKNIMWQKEAMLNIALKNLPKDCDKIAWLDADVIFQNYNWVKETAKLLEDYNVVQPFSYCVRLRKGDSIDSLDLNTLKFGIREGEFFFSSGFKYPKNNFDFENYFESGDFGFAWCARKEIFDNIGFYDKAILGGADYLIAKAFYGINWIPVKDIFSVRFGQDFLKYFNNLSRVIHKSVYFTRGNLFHLWHGDFVNRNYDKRYKILWEENFSPTLDVSIGKNGLLEWSSDKFGLHDFVLDYFALRKECI